uniref:hypothetical protein n=1 Tax=Candidatus Electronema sp. TaxID=2698783 RepID=UPI0040560838
MKKVLSLFAAALFTVAASNAVFAEPTTEPIPAAEDAAAVTEVAEETEGKDVEKAEKAEEKDVEKAEKAEEKDVVEETKE